MLIEKIGIFILFLGPLVFFHELGHFLFARLFGVRVEVFSIGFGPKILKFKKGDTQYAISLIPLGGYVKMFGDDPLNKDSIAEEERKYSFTFKGKWARFWIVMGGPLANFIMAYVIFFFLFISGERLPELKMGVLPQGSTLFESGMRSGDVIKKVNGEIVYNPSDILLEADELIKTISVERINEMTKITLNMTAESFLEEFAKSPPTLRSPLLVDANGNKFVITSTQGKMNWDISYDQIQQSWSPEVDLFLYPTEIEQSQVTLDKKSDVNFNKEIKLKFENQANLEQALSDQGFKTLDLMVKSIKMKSPADKSGLMQGDVIISLEGKSIYSFEELGLSLQELKRDSVKLSLWRNGIVKNFEITPEVINQNGKMMRLIGVYSGGVFQPLKFIETESKGFVQSTVQSFVRTWETILKTLDGFKKLVTAKVSFKSVGGPLAIGKVASDSFHTSLSYFFQLMALISVNLGVINLFPIPVLDGGHIMFIILEVINRGPISRRKMEIAQQVGLSLLLMLMVGAIFNDFSRFF